MKGKALAAAVLLAAVLSLVLARRRADPGPAEPPRRPTMPTPADAPAVPDRPAPPSDPAPSPAPPRRSLERAAEIAGALILEGRRGPDFATTVDYATNLPVGYFQLLVRAFADEAFGVFSTRYLADPEKATVAYWALGELARLRHGPTMQLFNAQLEGSDPVRSRRAAKALVHYDVPQLAPRLLSLLPADPEHSDQTELARAALLTAAALPHADSADLDAALDRYRRLEDESGIDGWYGVAEARRRAAVMRASDVSTALAAAIRLDTDDRSDDLDRALWAADVAERRGLREVAPVLRDRVDREIRRLASEDRLGELDVLERHRRGDYDLSATHAFRSQDVAVIARLRLAVHRLGGELSEEERRWLDGLRLLRSPREYLVEAGLVAP